MGLGGEIRDGVDLVLGEELGHEGGVTDIAMGEDIARVGCEVGQIGGIAGVSEGVEVDEFRERRALFEETLTDEVGADKAGAAGDEEVHARNGKRVRRLFASA